MQEKSIFHVFFGELKFLSLGITVSLERHYTVISHDGKFNSHLKHMKDTFNLLQVHV